MDIESFECGSTLNNSLLFRQLKTKLGPGYLCRKTQAEATESRGRLNEAIETFFRHYITWDFISKSISLSGLGKPPVTQTHALHRNCVKKNLQSYTVVDELICEEPSASLHKKKKNEELTAEIESNLKNFSLKLIECSDDCLNCKVSDKNWTTALEKVAKQQSSKVVDLESQVLALHSEKKKLDDVIITYYKELAEGICLLYKLVDLREERLQLHLHFAKFFALKCAALIYKMRLMHGKRLISTYSEKSVCALQQIRTRMLDRAEILSAEISDNHAALHEYHLLGGDFEALVNEYCRLLSDKNRLKFSARTLQTCPKPTEESNPD